MGQAGKYRERKSEEKRSMAEKEFKDNRFKNKKSETQKSAVKGLVGRKAETQKPAAKGLVGRKAETQKPAVKRPAGKKFTEEQIRNRSIGNKRKREVESRSFDESAGKFSNNSEKKSAGNILEYEKCPLAKKCGGCDYQGISYQDQLEKKEKKVRILLDRYGKVYPILGMEKPYYYRNKVHAVFDRDKQGNPISGVYEKGTHKVVPVDSCMIEDQKADSIICTIRGLLKSFKIKTYDEDTGYGLLRHVLVKRGFATGEIMVVLVTASPVFPSKNNFVKALRKVHPEITTVIQNINGRGTSMVLGERDIVLYGKGYIEDVLCGCTFRISAQSFYQVNPLQTEKLYAKAIELAGLTGKEKVFDAYCGIGTIGLIASKKAGSVIGVELNPDAVRDAVVNAKRNKAPNIKFYCDDAGKFMLRMEAEGRRPDVVFMDPPRSGSDETFLECLAKLAPGKVVYISCNPETLARDLRYLKKKGYEMEGAWPVDMFPFCSHVETVCLLSKKDK